MSKDFYTAVEGRRSIYGIGRDSPLSDEKIRETIARSLRFVPSAFNCQSARIALLLGKEHDALWDIVLETLRAVVPAASFARTESKVNGFKAGYGTVLYFIDDMILDDLAKKFPAYADNFPVWGEQENGMLQFSVWTSLELEGLGANLQHYNPIIDKAVKERWDIPDHWRLRAQMPFGSPAAKPEEKSFKPIEGRMKVYG